MSWPHLRQLEAFRAVASTQSFARAADTLCVTQPAISSHIRGLEGYLQVKLFEPSGRGVKLTGAGRVVFGACERVFESLTEFEAALAAYRGLERGELTIGA